MRLLLILAMLLSQRDMVMAQLNTSPGGSNNTGLNGSVKDTTHAKTNTNDWKSEDAKIYFQQLHSEKKLSPDTSLHTFQRRPFVQPWARDLGNPGSPVYNLLFAPENRVGPSLGYHSFDVYRFDLDSLNYYNTTRPYSIFKYQLGSKLEQVAGILHTQNIKPNWNFMVEYRKTNAPGFYKIQRNNHDNFCFSTRYTSPNKHYYLSAGMVYNNEQHDENGGIVNDSELTNAAYTDRRTVDAAYQNGQYSLTRSTVTNMQRDFGVQLQHSYIFGPVDTVYNADSTQYATHLKQRFSITHQLSMSTEKHLYKDLAPDSLRYISLFTASFGNGGAAYYIPGGDSVTTNQQWFWVDNRVLLNGFLGRDSSQLQCSAGIGYRYDQFTSDMLQNGGLQKVNTNSNYITGELKKEALKPGAWEYGGSALVYVTGSYAGNFKLRTLLGKSIGSHGSNFVAGFEQSLGSAPYSYSTYQNPYANLSYSFNKESITTAFASVDVHRWRLSLGARNYILDNYIYISKLGLPAQYNVPLNIAQVWARKVFRVGNFYLDNELVYQKQPTHAPVNLPELMGRNQLSYERQMFNKALKVATGIEVRYNTAYKPAGYNALLNRFYHQDSAYVSNNPELSVFLNFSVRHFRAFVMVDQVQQLFAKNAVLFTGTTATNFSGLGRDYLPVYATQNTMLRFGFSWVLVN